MDPEPKPMNLGSGEPSDPATALAAAIAERAEAQRIGLRHEVARSEPLFEQGRPLDRAFILHSGLVKLTYATASGEEWIKSLIVDHGVFGPSGQGPSASIAFSAVAVERSVLAAVPIGWLSREIAGSPTLAAAHARFIDWVRLRKEAREQALLCQSAEERYRDLLASDADLIARLPQADIARFLRITPVAFSRIKRRMRGG
ncbi:Crp/Fnr family transcriptional regulator [Sphingomonas koreensis]